MLIIKLVTLAQTKQLFSTIKRKISNKISQFFINSSSLAMISLMPPPWTKQTTTTSLRATILRGNHIPWLRDLWASKYLKAWVKRCLQGQLEISNLSIFQVVWIRVKVLVELMSFRRAIQTNLRTSDQSTRWAQSAQEQHQPG